MSNESEKEPRTDSPSIEEAETIVETKDGQAQDGAVLEEAVTEENATPEESDNLEEAAISEEVMDTDAVLESDEDDASSEKETDTDEGSDSDVDDTNTDEESDRFYEYLANEYRKFRTLSWVLGGLGLAIILIAVSLNINGIMSFKIYNLMMTIAYLFILLMFITIFTRSRPFKRRMKEVSGEPLHTIRDDDAPDGVRMEENPQFRNMDDIYKILERDIRTEVIPEYPGYKRLRKIWLTVYVVAAVLAIVSLCLYYFKPELNLLASLMLLAAFICVIVAFYIDRTKMRPMRVKWAKEFGMTEMQLRDNLRDYKNGHIDKADDSEQ